MVNIGEAFKFGSGGIENKTGYENIGMVISKLLPNVLVIASVILLFLLIAGGFAIITGGGDPEKQAGGNKAITAAITGFAIIFVSYWIIQILETITGLNLLNPGV